MHRPVHRGRQVRQLKRQLAMERKTASQLRGNLVRSQLSRSELESFFMHALEVGTIFLVAGRIYMLLDVMGKRIRSGERSREPTRPWLTGTTLGVAGAGRQAGH